jgi:2-hydroxychromene-2-carboxylate isomerase
MAALARHLPAAALAGTHPVCSGDETDALMRALLLALWDAGGSLTRKETVTALAAKLPHLSGAQLEDGVLGAWLAISKRRLGHLQQVDGRLTLRLTALGLLRAERERRPRGMAATPRPARYSKKVVLDVEYGPDQRAITRRSGVTILTLETLREHGDWMSAREIVTVISLEACRGLLQAVLTALYKAERDGLIERRALAPRQIIWRWPQSPMGKF